MKHFFRELTSRRSLGRVSGYDSFRFFFCVSVRIYVCVCVCVCLSVYLSAMSLCVYVCIHVVLLFVQLSLQLEYIVSAFYNTFRRVSATIDLTPWKKTAYRARFVRPSSFSFPLPRLAAPLSINIDELTEITHRATRRSAYRSI